MVRWFSGSMVLKVAVVAVVDDDDDDDEDDNYIQLYHSYTFLKLIKETHSWNGLERNDPLS